MVAYDDPLAACLRAQNLSQGQLQKIPHNMNGDDDDRGEDNAGYGADDVDDDDGDDTATDSPSNIYICI